MVMRYGGGNDPFELALHGMPTVLRNVFIFTGSTDYKCIPNGAVVVENEAISWIGPDGELPARYRAGARDMARRVVMPGMINTHAHGGLTVHRGQSDDGDLFQWAAALASHTSTLTLEDNRWGCYLAIFEMVRNGITTVCDCARYGAGVFSEVASKVGVRSLSGAMANSPSLRTVGQPNWPGILDETKQAIGARGNDGLSRFFVGAHSPYNCTPDLLVETKRAADDLGLPFVIHAAESAKEVDTIQDRHGRRPIELLHHLGLLDRSSILAHCVWVDEGEIEMLAASGAGVAHNPISNAKLASGVAPVPALRHRGVPVGLGTDSSVSNNSLSLFQEMKFAVLLQRATTLDGTVMGARDALSMATREGARVLGWDQDIGSLERGKQADLVVLDLDHPLGLTPERVMSDIVYAAGPQNVEAVMVRGEFVYESRQFTKIDEAGLRSRIRRHFAS
jgi:5-methylthioadenosine/S-adenosylhomocysteine deaminase